MEKTEKSLFVLFTVPLHQVAPGACYIAWDGYPTILRSKAAGFQSFADAKAFAKESRIALNGLTYIGLEGRVDILVRDFLWWVCICVGCVKVKGGGQECPPHTCLLLRSKNGFVLVAE